MVDMLPFPRVIGNTPQEQIAELLSYLIQFKETLEFALTNISTENLSPDLVNKLNELGANIEKSYVDREDELTQISKNTLTISDVCESNTFKDAVEDEMYKHWLTFSVNYETGHLEYAKAE
jgi:hypothetical protein